MVVDAYGREVLRVYKVAAYMYAFGGSNDTLPANYTSKKATKVGTSPWGIYLRSNHSLFSGNTSKYPCEPILPDISGCCTLSSKTDYNPTPYVPTGYASFREPYE